MAFQEDITEPECYALLLVYADTTESYLWDMNSVSISLTCVTGREHEPLDDEFLAWDAIYDGRTVDDIVNGIWPSPEALAEFNAQGLALSRKLHAYLGGRHKIVYYPTGGGAAVELDAIEVT